MTPFIGLIHLCSKVPSKTSKVAPSAIGGHEGEERGVFLWVEKGKTLCSPWFGCEICSELYVFRGQSVKNYLLLLTTMTPNVRLREQK